MNMNFSNQRFGMKKSSHVNGFVDVMAHNKSLILRERLIRTLVQNRMLAFLQLAAIRCTALKFETWILDHPEIELPEDLEEEDLRWENAGFDYDLPAIIREHQSRSRLMSPVASHEPNLRISRVRSMVYAADQRLRRRQLLLPSPRHLPSDDPPSPSKALLSAFVLMGPRRDPTPEFPSKLRAMVQAQGDERLTEMHGDFEKFRITGKQPDRKNTEEKPGSKRYHSELSDYRPYSASPTTARAQARAGPALFGPPGLDQPPVKRLRSTELFPDRYIAEEATRAPDAIQTKARNSVGESADVPIRDSAGEGTGISTRDFAYSVDSTTTSYESGGQAKPSVQSDPQPSSVPPSRRSAARSDSSLSSVSSTESSRARKALALTLSEDQKRVQLNSGKSAASVGMSSNSPSLFRSFMNAMSPSGSKPSAEDETRKLNRSPTRRESHARCASGSGPSLDGTSEGGGLVRSSSKRSRASTVPASSSKRRQKQRQTDDETAPNALLSEIRILPKPWETETDENSTVSSSREGMTEGGEESHSNPASTSVYPAGSESRKPPV